MRKKFNFLSELLLSDKCIVCVCVVVSSNQSRPVVVSKA